MDNTTIQRYQPGGDIYLSLQTTYGTASANAIAAAALSGDESQVNSAITEAKFGNPLNDSTISILGTQLATDPLGAPLDALDNTASNLFQNTFDSFLRNKTVLTIAIVGAFLYLGGAKWIKDQINKK